MAVKKSPQMRLNANLKRAIHSGDGYTDYMTVYQFLMQKKALLDSRIKRMRYEITRFFDDGGEVHQSDGNAFDVELRGVRLTVSYDDDGEVTDYSVTGLKRKREVVDTLLSLFFCTHMIPIYEGMILTTQNQLSDLDNDNVLRGMSELRDIIRGDKYLTVGAISGVRIETEDDTDPFGLFEGDPE